MQRQPGNVGVTGGIAIASGVTLFALITFPPLGIVVGLISGAIILDKLAQRRRRRQMEMIDSIAIQGFYEKVDQREMTNQWTNPGWRQ